MKDIKGDVANQISRGALNVIRAQEVAKEKNKRPIRIWNSLISYEFSSTKEACDKLNLTPGKVTDVLKGRRNQHKGYKASYL